MKKLLIISSSLLLLFSITSCTDSEKEVKPTVQELYPSPTVKIGFTVHVLPSSEAAKSAGLIEATVTLKQNGKVYNSVTDETGIASFEGLTEGEVSWFVKKTGFSTTNGTSNIAFTGSTNVNGTNGTSTSNGSVTVNNEQTSSTSVFVTLPRLGASVVGKVRGDLDGSGPGAIATLSSGTVRLVLDNTTLQPNVYTSTIGGDGEYTFANLPEGEDFSLQTVNIFSVSPAAGNFPTQKNNLNFSNLNGTTPIVGNTLYLGVSDLN